jgi:hypothetical protein
MKRMRSKHTVCVSMLIMALLSVHISVAAPYFRGTSLMNIPTADVMSRGIFSVGIHTAIQDQKRDELAMRVDFGVLSFVELGLMGVKWNGEDYVVGSAKLIITREVGSIPSLSMGVDNFGEKIRDTSGSYERSIYGVLSKRFNLPAVHLISGHLGIRGHRYVSETSVGKYLHGVFMGLDKEFALLDRRLRLMCEVDGSGLNTGLQYMMDSGLSVSMAAGPLSSGSEDIKYYLGIGFTNESMMKKIDQNAELAKRAVKIANEARSSTDKTETSK